MSSDLPMCPSCGERNDPDAKFCGYCGHALEQAVPEPAAPAPTAPTPAAPISAAITPATGGPATPRPRPAWLLPAAGSAAVIAVAAAVVLSGIFPVRKAPPPPPPPVIAAVAVDRFELTGISPSATKSGLRVALQGTFVLTGAKNGTSVQVLPAWRTSGGSIPLRYGTPISVKANNGMVAVGGTVSATGVAQSDSILVYLVARIGGKEWLSAPGSVVVASVPPPPPPVLPRPPVSTTPSPPPPPVPVRRQVPAPASAPSTEAAAALNLRLTPASPVRIPPGGRVLFDLSFVLAGEEQARVSQTLAYRDARGTWQYGTFGSFRAVRGTNVIHGLYFNSKPSTPVGMSGAFYGVVQLNGKIYRSQSPVVVTIVPPTAAEPSTVPVPSTPPTPTPPIHSVSSGRSIVMMGQPSSSPANLTGIAVAAATEVFSQNGVDIRSTPDPARPAPMLRLIASPLPSSRTLNLGPVAVHAVYVRVDAYLTRLDGSVWRGSETGSASYASGPVSGSQEQALEKATRDAASKLALEALNAR